VGVRNHELNGLVLDWGGVLTASLDGAMSQWAVDDGVDFTHFVDVMRQWVGVRQDGPVAVQVEQAADDGPAGDSPVHRLERGELAAADFEHLLARELAARGSVVEAAGLLDRLLGGLAHLDPRMVDLVRRARAAGLRTALLSNSWGEHYPDQLWDGLFDSIVISGRVGMRKPDRAIFDHTVGELGLTAAQCVMVDDIPRNVDAAVAAGMVGVLHRSVEETMTELEALFEVPLH
jgi:putative hydrolase of the HAD superfamily